MKDIPISPAFSADVQIGSVEIKDGSADTRAAVITDNATATATPNVLMTGAIYKSSADTYADNDASPLHTDVNGKLLTLPAGASAANTARTTATIVQPVQQVSAAGAVDTLTTVTTVGTVTTLTGGGVASDAADSGNPIKVGGKYTAAGVTLDDGDRGDLNLDAAGNLLVSNNTLISGEDQTNDVMKVEEQFTSTLVAAAGADNVIKASPGYLKGIILGGIPAADAIIEVSDHASDGDGNVVIYAAGGDGTDSLLEQTLVDKHSGYIPVNAKFTVGITADITAQTNVIFVWR